MKYIYTPAFPNNFDSPQRGISARAYFAAAALSGLAQEHGPVVAARKAVEYADALIVALATPVEPAEQTKD